jgi:L-alanine-DL-glutamate epimerase-like enolase superfamily enzyme
MAITRVSARGMRVPVALNLSQSTRRLNQRDYIYVAISDSDSEFVGEGLSYVGTAGAKAAVELVDDVLAPTVIGADSADVVGLYARLYQEALMQGRRGMAIRCIAAIDIALWDLASKKAGLPLASMLGGRTGSVPAYASGGYYRAGDDDRVRTIREEIEFNKSLGFKDHKMKVGGLSVREDAERVRAAVELLDPDGRLALDANNAYRTPAEAIHATVAFEKAAGDHGLWWIEEPLTPDNIAGHAMINRTVLTPVATGEVHQTRHEFLQLLQQDAASVLQADVGVVGGITEWLTISRTALAFGVPVAPHWHANIHVHLLAASENALVLEHFAPEKGIYNMAELMTPESALQHENGQVFVPERPGIGWEFDAEKLDAYEAK